MPEYRSSDHPPNTTQNSQSYTKRSQARIDKEHLFKSYAKVQRYFLVEITLVLVPHILTISVQIAGPLHRQLVRLLVVI